MNALDNLNDLILYDFTDVLDRMHLPFPLTTRYLHPEVSHKISKIMRNLVLFTSMILSFWGCSNDKDFGGLENIGWNEKPLQITTRYPNYKIHQFYTRI